MSDISDYSAFDLLDVPIIVFADRRAAYMNAALCQLVGIEREKLLGFEAGSRNGTRYLMQGEALTSKKLMELLERGETAPRELWVEFETSKGLIRTAVRPTRGRRSGEWIMTLLDVPGVAEARRMTESLIQGTPELLRARSEARVLEHAIHLLSEHGMFATFLFIKGPMLFHGPMFQDPEAVKVTEGMYGRPMTEVPIPRANVVHLEHAIRSGRATFHEDIFTIIRQIHSPEVIQFMEKAVPHMPAMDAVVFVGDAPFGLLAVMGPGLTPATAVSVELFVKLVGSAVENVRHTLAAEHQVAELHRLQRELVDRERLATLGQAGAVVAHEVRNPLGAIINAVAVLHRDRALRDDSAQVVQVIEEEAHRLDRLVGDLLAFARPMEPRPSACDVYDLAQRVVAAVRHERMDVRISLAEPPPLLPVRADPDLLVLALKNLVRNGVQASPKGGTVHVELATDERHAQISVHDEGQGVAPPDADKIFAPFFTTRATGTGLGLSVVHRVATAHDGQVKVTRSRFGGAEFTLELPRKN